jgi:hypothetical protein
MLKGGPPALYISCKTNGHPVITDTKAGVGIMFGLRVPVLLPIGGVTIIRHLLWLTKLCKPQLSS